jgi:hypothetical protein
MNKPEVGHSPIFVCTFADRETTRMTTFQSSKTLNLVRGTHLARAAYESRMKKAPPPIVEAHYEREDGEVLESYTREQLDAVP